MEEGRAILPIAPLIHFLNMEAHSPAPAEFSLPKIFVEAGGVWGWGWSGMRKEEGLSLQCFSFSPPFLPCPELCWDISSNMFSDLSPQGFAS